MQAISSNTDVIPFLDLVTPHTEMEEELVEVFRAALRTASFVGGEQVRKFEQEFAKYCGADHSIAVASGTDALRFALMAAGIQPGDAVVTVPNTFIATTEAISQAGAHPEFVDADEQTYNLSPAALRRYLEQECRRVTGRGLVSLRSGLPVRAIVPVHLYGQMADMDAILALAGEYGLIVVEDACQAHGAEYFSQRLGRWVRAGAMGRAAGFSFYPGKNLGACGEGGAITTDDTELAKRVKMLRDHGQSQKYYHEIEGYNGRLDSIQTGILSVKLARLDEWNNARRDHAAAYSRMLEGVPGVITPSEPAWSRAVYHLYVIRVADRDGLIQHLKEEGMGTGIHYPVPLHLQNAYTALGYKPGDFPVSEKAAREIVSLPMYPQLTPEQQLRVVEQVIAFVK